MKIGIRRRLDELNQREDIQRRRHEIDTRNFGCAPWEVRRTKYLIGTGNDAQLRAEGLAGIAAAIRRAA